jgi:hypothetical protein
MDSTFASFCSDGGESHLPQLTSEQRSEYLARATAARQERSRVLHGIKKGTIDPREVLGSSSDVIRNIRVKAFVESWPGIGQAKAEAILKRNYIPSRRHLKGLGKNQRKQLIAEMPPFGDDSDEEELHSAHIEH